MVLRSARTLIRPWQRTDDELADEWPSYHDPLEPLWNLSRPASANDWYSGFDIGGTRRTWAVENPQGQLMGRISLREVDGKRGRARLGITFGAPFVGQGLGTEALACFLDYYFTDFGFFSMVLDVAATNQRAVRSYERLGFHYVPMDDWRAAMYSFDRRIVADPRYAHLRQFFKEDKTQLKVRFFEMELSKAEWLGRNASTQHG